MEWRFLLIDLTKVLNPGKKYSFDGLEKYMDIQTGAGFALQETKATGDDREEVIGEIVEDHALVFAGKREYRSMTLPMRRIP